MPHSAVAGYAILALLSRQARVATSHGAPTSTTPALCGTTGTARARLCSTPPPFSTARLRSRDWLSSRPCLVPCQQAQSPGLPKRRQTRVRQKNKHYIETFLPNGITRKRRHTQRCAVHVATSIQIEKHLKPACADSAALRVVLWAPKVARTQIFDHLRAAFFRSLSVVSSLIRHSPGFAPVEGGSAADSRRSAARLASDMICRDLSISSSC